MPGKYSEKNNNRLIRFIILHKNNIIVLFLLGLFSNVFYLTLPYLSGLFVDKVFFNRNAADFTNLSILGGSIFAVSMLITCITDIVRNRISIRFKLNLANRVMKKFYSLDMRFFQENPSGENIYRFFNSEVMADFILEQCPQFLINISRFFIILAVSFCLNARLTVFLIILSPLFLVHSIYMQRKLQHAYKEFWRYSINQSQHIYEAFSKMQIIKAFGLEDYQRHKYLSSLIKNMRWRIKSFYWTTVSSLSSQFLSRAIYGLITVYGGWLIIKGKLQPGSYTAVMVYITQLGGMVETLIYSFERFNRDAVALNESFEIMDMRPKIKDLPGAISLKDINGEIRFENIYFGYDDKRVILNNLNLSIPYFSWIGIAGSSGCGKTTLINLIIRLYEPCGGRILIGGIDIKKIELKSLKKRIIIAAQQLLLFDASIRDNIAYGLKYAKDNDVKRAAKICCIDNFIETLPNGYNTLIGDNGCRLSQGQKQRISLARAIIRSPDVLILDEATSSVDSLTEEAIFRNLREERKGLSTIIISHSLLSMVNAERIYFIKKGGGVEEGMHHELLAESEAYGDFFHNQLTHA